MKPEPNLRNHTHRLLQGFTLVEMLLVLVILGILASIVYPTVIGRDPDVRKKATRTQIAAIEGALDTFEVDNGRFPSTQEGLQALMQPPQDTPDWHGPYVKRLPKDPWGTDYLYDCPGRHNTRFYDVMSAGPDRTPETGDDITNWESGQ